MIKGFMLIWRGLIELTEKRFNYQIDEVGIEWYVCDNTKKGDDRIILEFDTKFDAIEVCDLLNKLNDENEQLKKELFETMKDYILETYADNTIRRDEKLKALEKELEE